MFFQEHCQLNYSPCHNYPILQAKNLVYFMQWLIVHYWLRAVSGTLIIYLLQLEKSLQTEIMIFTIRCVGV